MVHFMNEISIMKLPLNRLLGFVQNYSSGILKKTSRRQDNNCYLQLNIILKHSFIAQHS